MKLSKSHRRLVICTALSVVATGVALSCGGDNVAEDAGDTNEPSGTGGTLGSAGTSSGTGGETASGDTGAAETAAGASGAPVTDQCTGSQVYEASWTEQTGSEGPSARLSHAMADTPAGIVLFGGGTLLLGGLDDTWVWDQGAWRESEAAGAPPSRAGHDMASTDDGVILFGGDGGDLLNDLWRYSNDNWEELCADDACGDPPVARSGLAISYDTTRHKLVLFGGFDGESALQDTWEWDPDSGWQEVCGNDCTTGLCCEPPPRHDHRMVYDSVKQRILMFGGTNDESELDDLWAYDTNGWHEVTGRGPSARAGHTFAFDPVHGVVLLFGGTAAGSAVADDAWLFDVVEDDWTPLDSGEPAPPGREFAAMAFDRDNHQFVMFGGGDSGQYQDTWTMSYEVAGCVGAGGAAGAAGAPGEPDPGNPGN